MSLSMTVVDTDRNRTITLPRVLAETLRVQMEEARALHDRDVGEGFGGVWMPDALAVKVKTTPSANPFLPSMLRSPHHDPLRPLSDATGFSPTGGVGSLSVNNKLDDHGTPVTTELRVRGLYSRSNAETWRQSVPRLP